MFNEVYQRALEARSIDELIAMLQGSYQDPLQKGFPFHIPASLLAYEGQDEKANWFYQLGSSAGEIAEGYALAGNHTQVERYRTERGANVDLIARGYAKAGNEKKVEEYRLAHHADPSEIAMGFAMAGYDDKAEAYRENHKADPNLVVMGYAAVGHHKKVEEYLAKYAVDIERIVFAYALAGHHGKVLHYQTSHKVDVNLVARAYVINGNFDDKVETYRKKYHAHPDQIAKAYAMINFHQKVEAYRIRHQANPQQIVCGYIRAENHEKVEAYRVKYHLDVKSIAKSYKGSENPPLFYQCISKLMDFDDDYADKIIEIMKRLKNGEEQPKNPYWMKSGNKLQRIMDEVHALDDADALNNAMISPHSPLVDSINWQRMLPVTFFGKFGIKQTKSLMILDEVKPFVLDNF